MKTLVIRHIDQSEPAQFEVVRLPDGKSVGPATVPSPVGFPVKDRPNSDLMAFSLPRSRQSHRVPGQGPAK